MANTVNYSALAAADPFARMQNAQTWQEGNNRKSYLYDVGQQLASGDMQGAAQSAFATGDPQMINTGMQLAKYDQDRSLKMVNFFTEAAQRADTPEKWAKVVDVGRGIFGPKADEYADFNTGRPNAITAFQQVQLDMKERQFMEQQKTAKIKEYEYARVNGFPGTFADWLKEQSLSGAKYGMGGQLVRTPDGSIGVLQPGSQGDIKISPLPSGTVPLVGGTKIIGNEMYQSATGQPVRDVTPAIAGGKKAEVEGKEAGTATVNLPKVKSSAKITMDYIDAVLNDKNLENVTGIEAWTPTFRAASQDTQSRIGQLKGRAFLAAYDELRGAGQITEVEGQKAAEAKARLDNLFQSDAGYRKALMDFKREVEALVRLAYEKAGQTPPDGARSGSNRTRRKYNPATGEIE